MNALYILLNNNAKKPTKATLSSAGYDLYSPDKYIIASKSNCIIPLGIKIKIPDGFYGDIKHRSGLLFNNGVKTEGGVIDSDYTGEIQVYLSNISNEDYEINIGDRIAQMIIQPYMNMDFQKVDILDITERGEGGFGSSGL